MKKKLIQCDCRKSEGERCRNEATREISVFQEGEHPKIGTGWYWIRLCEKHFWDSDVSAKIKMKGRQDWKYIKS